jgi:hypothetical protein
MTPLHLLFVCLGWSGLLMDYVGFKFPCTWFSWAPAPDLALPASNVHALPFGTGWHDVWLPSDPHPRDFSFFSEFPVLRKWYTDYELHWDEPTLWLFMRSTWWLPFVLWCLYYLAVVQGEKYMRNREALQVRAPLVVWNFSLAIFSAVGAARVLPQVLYPVYRNGLDFTLCRASSASGSFFKGPSGLWWSLFIFSKFVELLDTAFLVLRKRPVQPLHHLHHGVTMCAMWSSGGWEDPVSMFPVGMNYLVHALMYTYFGISALHRPPAWGVLITAVQILQMLAGSLGFTHHFLLMHTVPNCAGAYSTTWSGMLYYTVFFFWFCNMGYERWFKVGRVKRKTN